MKIKIHKIKIKTHIKPHRMPLRRYIALGIKSDIEDFKERINNCYIIGKKIPKDKRIICDAKCRWYLYQWFGPFDYTNDQIIELFEQHGITAPFTLEGIGIFPNEITAISANGSKKYIYEHVNFRDDKCSINFISEDGTHESHVLGPWE